ncbi:hypothetical protein WJX73_006611 [Symbiochloris irregularis]|uniref:Uncharacterized protein n=1 Tax=Symbiochloris irregularis TaxID=706552 RepID=A0AAW1NVF7_9CHLO
MYLNYPHHGGLYNFETMQANAIAQLTMQHGLSAMPAMQLQLLLPAGADVSKVRTAIAAYERMPEAVRKLFMRGALAGGASVGRYAAQGDASLHLMGTLTHKQHHRTGPARSLQLAPDASGWECKGTSTAKPNCVVVKAAAAGSKESAKPSRQLYIFAMGRLEAASSLIVDGSQIWL